MEKNEKKPIHERIEDLRNQICTTTDKHHVKTLLDQLLSLQRQADVVPSELTIPVSEIKDSIDFGACKVSKTIRGYLFEAKGGLYTFVESRMAALCAVFNTLFDLHHKEDKTSDENELYESFASCLQYVYQAPIFASMSLATMYEVATDLLKRFNAFAEENFTNTEAVDETEEDIKENIAFDNIGKAMETITSAPIPSEI